MQLKYLRVRTNVFLVLTTCSRFSSAAGASATAYFDLCRPRK